MGSFVKLMNEDITHKNINESLDAFKYNHCLFCFYAICVVKLRAVTWKKKNKTPHVLECHEAAVFQNGNVDTGTCSRSHAHKQH